MRSRSRRNPDMEAYRAWHSDRNDREALKRYLLSMDRGREIIGDMERIVELTEAVSHDDTLRQIYERLMPDSSERWVELINRISGRNIDRKSIIILLNMGIRSGIPIRKVYRTLHEKGLTPMNVYEDFLSMRGDYFYNQQRIIHYDYYGIPIFTIGLESYNPNLRLASVMALSRIEFKTPSIVESLIRIIDNTREDQNIVLASIVFLGKIGSMAAPSVRSLVRILEEVNMNFSFRLSVIRSIGDINEGKEISIPSLIDVLSNESENEIVKCACVDALGKLGGESSQVVSVLSDIITSKETNAVLLIRCIDSLGKIGHFARSSIGILNKIYNKNKMSEYEDVHQFNIMWASRNAIERITGERPE